MQLTTKFSTKRLLTALFLLPFLAFAQPVNDDCADAISLGTLPTPGACVSGLQNGAPVTLTNQSTVGATGQNPYSSIVNCTGGGNMTSPAVDTWYTCVSSGTTVNVVISGFPNASVGVWTGSCGNLTPRGCMNVNGTGNGTLVITQSNPGEILYIQISGGSSTATDGSFTLAVDNDIDCNDCLLTTNLVATPPPVNGTYLPGQVVNFCFTVEGFSEQNTNWFHGVQITMGAGWTGVISSPVPAADCAYDPTPGPGNAGAGTWGFYNSVTSAATGQTFGPGFYFDNVNVAGTNPGQNFGDPTNGNCTWTFCWNLTVSSGCTPGANLSVTVNTTGDGESGSWQSVACTDDDPTVAAAYMICCGIPTSSTVNESCPGAGDGSATVTGQGGTSPYDYVWTNSGGTVLLTQNNISVPSTLTGLASGTYTVTVTDATGCVQVIDVVVGADPCATCPTYGAAVASSSACGGQMYDFMVPNTGCNGTLSFNVVGNYGSLYGSEITWSIISVQTGAVVASGGPGTNNGVINVNVNLDPNITGNVFNLIVNDAFGDGFNGTGGTISVTANGSTVAGPITGNFGSTTNQVFAVNIDISPTTLTIITPSGNVVDLASNCADHTVQFALANTNYCTPIVVNLPWTVVCDLTGAVLASGTQPVTVYPQIATAFTNVVDISWNTATCQWNVTPQNDCDNLDIGSVFTISPNPAAWPANTCAGGSQTFTVNYLGVSGSPDCCATGGPLVPITYNATTTVGNAVVQSSIYGGTNNAAVVTIPGNGTGGNSTSFSMNISGSGYCYPNPAGTSTDQTYYIAVWVDGVQVLLQGPLSGGTFNVNVTQAMLTAAGVVYNENSVIQVYLLPNLFSQGGNNTTYVPGAACGSLTDGQWTVGSYNITMNASYVEQTAGPANCTFTSNKPYTCCINNGPVVPANGSSTVNCASLATQPAAPAVVDACGNNLVPVITASATPACEGTKVYTYTYTDCDNNQSVYTYTYTINIPALTIATPPGASTVTCPSAANVQPAGPGVITNACGTVLTPTITSTPALTCEGTRVWTFTYTSCDGTTASWTYTYTVNIPALTIAAAPGGSTVNCVSNAMVQPAGPGVITNACGTVLTPTITPPTAVACEGPMVWTFTYTSCDGTTANWTYTYTVNIPALTIAVAPGASTVNCAANAMVQPAGPGVITNACGTVLTPTITPPSPVACEGPMVWTFTYTSCDGTTANWLYTYTVNIPAISIAAAPGASTVNCPSAANVQPAGPGVVTDACGTVLTPTITSTPAVTCEGTRVWTFTYTNCDGSSAVWTYTYTVDIPAFTIATPPGASTVNCSAAGLVQPTPPAVTDACGNALTPTVSAPAAVACEGPMVWTFTYTDCAGNTANWTYTYTVDIPAFTIATPPGASTVNCPSAGSVQPTPPVVTNACGTAITPTVSAPAAVACEGPMVWTFTYTDCAGNTANWTYTYTVDMPAFTIAAPAGSSTVNCPSAGLVQPTPPVVTDACGNTITPTVSAPTAVACEGNMVWTFTYTDCAANTANWLYTYVVDRPTFTIATPPGASTVNCPSAGLVQPTPPSVTDACGTALTPTVSAPAAVACEGPMVWTFTYTDCAGNSANWTYTYTVDMPTFTIGVPNSNTTAVCVASIVVPTPPAGIVDACGNPVVPVMTENATPVCVGNKIYTFTYTDCAGNTAVWTATIAVNDNVPPTGTAPANQSLPGGPVPPPDVNLITNEADNCTANPTVTFIGDVSNGGTCPEIITRTYRITDDCGNFIDVVQVFTIGDAIMPTASNPANINVECISMVPAPDPNVVTDEADNGATPIVTFESDVMGGGSCPDTLIRTYRVTDDCGNYIFVTQLIIIEPVTPPVVPANGASTVNCVAAAQVQPTPPSVTDVCGNALTPVVTAPAAVACEGPMVWTFTYTDCAGNSANWTYTYTVDMPAFVLPANGASTVNCVAAAQVQPTPPVVSDVCGNAITPSMTAPTAVACEGPMAWVFTYTDCAGNTANWTYTYTVDMPAFVLPANGASTVNCVAAAQVQPVAPTMNDMCGNAMTPTVTAPAAVACEGPMIWTFTYTDCAGNTANWTYTYTVDMPAFVLPANGASTVNCVAAAQVQPVAPAMNDVCGNAITPTVAAPAAVACEGPMAWVFTYTDCAGNTANWTYTYTVDMPAFTIPYPNAGSTVNCVADAQVQPASPGVVTDMCGNVLTPVITAPNAAGCTGVGAVWTFTYTDCAGNTANWTYTYTINLAPFTIPFADAASTVNCVANAQVQPVPPAVVTDACGNTITPTVAAPTAVACEGPMAWVFTYTDCAGNTANWTYTYTVDMPAFVMPANGASTVNCVAAAQVQPVAPTMNDMCGNAMTPTVTVPAAVACEGPMVWTFTYTDCAGNTANWTYTYTVDMPAFVLPANGASTVNCVAGAQVQPVAPAMNDVCGNAITPTVAAPAAVACEGPMAWVFTYTDCAGNTANWTYTYTVDMPAFVLPANGASTVNCVAAAQVQPTPPVAVTDVCGNTITPTVTAPTAVACEGPMVWTFTYTDCAGNTANWTYTYTVDMPAFVLPANGASTVNCVAAAQVQPVAPTVNDMCGNAITPTVTAPAAVACEGPMVWTFTYTDCAGNTANWTYTYTVDMPAFVLPANGASTVNCVAAAQVQPVAPAMNDMCGNAIVPTVTAPSAVACEGPMVWTFTYTDCAGNTANWTYTYTVNMPAFVLPANGASTVNCVANAQVQPAAPAVADVCGNAIVPTVTAPAAVACEGPMVWTFTYTDCAGNTANWTYTYTVDMPAFVLPANGGSTVSCVSAAQVQPAAPAMNDVCGNAITPTVTTPAAIACEGTMAWVFTYTDCAGNTSNWTYTYTIDLNTSPVVPANQSSAVQCIADVTVPTPPAVVDACGNNVVPVMTESPDPVCVGDKVYTFTYTDCAGNASVWTYTYSINDNIAPTASNPTAISVPGANDVPAPDPLVVTDEADNCTLNPVVAWVSDVSDGNVCNGEIITRVYSITDDCGNVSFVTQLITIEAVYPPIDAGPDATICMGEGITLTANNPLGVPISWNPSNPPIDGVEFFPSQTATYTVTADNQGCISTDQVTITVEDLPTVSFIGGEGGCAPTTVSFNSTSVGGSNLTNCVWAIDGNIVPGDCNGMFYTFTSGGYYDVSLTVTSANGCTASVTYDDYIFMESVPNASFSVSSMDLSNLNTEIHTDNTSTGAVSYQWSFGDGSSVSNAFEPVHVFPDEESGSYVIQLVAYSEVYGCTDTAWVSVNVEEEVIFYVPNTFTPDGDSYNEYFKAIFTSGFDPYDFTLLIFDRWGEIIWESHNADIGWDGTYGGNVVQDGTYVWKIEFKTTATDERRMITGHVNVMK